MAPVSDDNTVADSEDLNAVWTWLPALCRWFVEVAHTDLALRARQVLLSPALDMPTGAPSYAGDWDAIAGWMITSGQRAR
jgi:hypothetical protein